jgi:Uma2 family endonuclease
MKAVMVDVPQFISEWRKTTGADRFDEMWDGVLHMGPTPNRTHQDLEGALETWLRNHWAPLSGGKVYHQINVASVGGWTSNYRVPDLVLLTPERFAVDRNEYFEGGPSAVVEIRSPGDESYEKLPFYAAIGVPEVWVIDRDTRQPELHVLADRGYRLQAADADGWLDSSLGVQLRRSPADKLLIRLSGLESSQGVLPDGQ